MHYSNDVFLKLKYTTQVFLANTLLLHTLLFSQTLSPYKKGSSSSCTIVWCHTRKNPGEKRTILLAAICIKWMMYDNNIMTWNFGLASY